MGKRSDFKRRKNDFYPTPIEPVIPLIHHLAPNTKFIEPCVGEGHLRDHLCLYGHTCVMEGDLGMDARYTKYHPDPGTVFITNPPWTREIMHPIIENLRTQAPTWLLFDAAWPHTKQCIPYLKYCAAIVTVGRVKWIPNTKYGSLDDAAWYLFVKEKTDTIFYGPVG